MSDWVPFSHRYGIANVMSVSRWCSAGNEQIDAEHWRFRHSPEITAWGEPDPLFRCVCLGSPKRPQCADRASQEDRLCDACREHCVAVDDAGRYHRLVDIYGSAQ